MCLIVFSGYSQNIKKIYKSIKNNELVEAIIESSKTDSKAKFDENENILFQLSQCVLQSISNSSIFKPYDAFNQFKSIPVNKADEINDYLNKYELNINKIQELIYTGVVYEAKKQNSESSYNKALEICKPCSYENELIELKTLSAFNEAKNIMSLTSLNKFINKYATSKFADLAVDMRDSLVYENTNKDYFSLLRFTKEYPNSKLTTKVILELPDVLYKEAIKSNDYEKLALFSKLYPHDSKILDIKKRIDEKEYYEISINKVNGWNLNDCDINVEYLKLITQDGLTEENLNTLGKIFKISKNGNYGILNDKGELISEIKYNEISDFINGYSVVRIVNKGDEYNTQNWKYSFVNLNGEEIIKNEYDIVLSPFIYGTSLVGLSENFMIIDTTGVVIKTINIKSDIELGKFIEAIGNGYFLFRQRIQKVGDPEGEKYYNKIIIINKIGKEVYAINDLTTSHDSYFFNKYLGFASNSNIAYSFDTKNGLLYDFKYSDNIELEEVYGNFAVMKKDNKLALSDITFKSLTPFKYDDIKFQIEKNDSVFVVRINNKWGIINNLGKELTQFKYDEIEFSNFGYITAKLNNKWGIINQLGQEITPFKYDEIEFLHVPSGFARAKIYRYSLEESNNDEEKFIYENRICKWTLINNLGQEITPFIFDNIFRMTPQLIKVEINDKVGIIDSSGHQILACKYNSEDIMGLVDGYFAMKNNEKWAIFNQLGAKITDFKYDEIIKINLKELNTECKNDDLVNIVNINLEKFNTLFSNKSFIAKQDCEWKIIKLNTKAINSANKYSNDNVQDVNKNLSETKKITESNNDFIEDVNNNFTETQNQSKSDIIYDLVDESPEFPGGMNAFYNSLNSKIIIPKVASDNNYSGNYFVKFIINENGSISNVTITRGIQNCKECDEEIIKALKELPKWRPGKINGKSVNSQLQIKIDFNK